MSLMILAIVVLLLIGGIAAAVTVAFTNRQRDDSPPGMRGPSATVDPQPMRVVAVVAGAVLALAGLALALVLSGGNADPGFPATEPGPTPGGSTSTWQIASDLEIALNAGDVGALASLVASDAMVVTPRQEVAGRQDLQQWVAAALRRTTIAASIRVDEVTAADTAAFAEGQFVVTLRPTDGGASVQETGAWMARLRRSGDGSWQLVRLIWN